MNYEDYLLLSGSHQPGALHILFHLTFQALEVSKAVQLAQDTVTQPTSLQEALSISGNA